MSIFGFNFKNLFAYLKEFFDHKSSGSKKFIYSPLANFNPLFLAELKPLFSLLI